MGKDRLFLIHCFQVEGDQSRHPATAMDDIGRPAEFFYCFQRTLAKEYRAEAVVIEPFFLFVVENIRTFEQVLVFQEIDL